MEKSKALQVKPAKTWLQVTSLTLRVAGLASVKAYEDSRGMIYVTWSIQAVKWMTNFEVQKRHDTGTNAHNYLGVPNWADGTADIMIIGSMSVYNPKYSPAKHRWRWHRQLTTNTAPDIFTNKSRPKICLQIRPRRNTGCSPMSRYDSCEFHLYIYPKA